MLINKEGKLFNKISIIDIFVILAVLVLLAGITLKFLMPNMRISANEGKIEYTMKVYDVRHFTRDALAKGGPISDSKTKEKMGVVINSSAQPAIKEIKKLDGTQELVSIPDKYDVTITIQADGKISESGYYTSDNKHIAAGSVITFNTKYAITTGEILSVKEIK